ncbi:von Willebrand factor type A domain-containing protein, partial [Roridomyces roridus]
MSAQLFGLYYYYSERRVRSTLPLLNVRVDASIKEVAAQVKLVQTFGNDANHPIEAFYSFPIPARAAVCSFAMIKQDGTRVNGRVQERGEARRTYTNAIRQGQQASLVEQQHPDVFHIAVGNIPSKEQVKVELVYATELAEDEENDSIRFHLPTCIGTRYGQTPKLMLSFIRNPFSNPFYTSNNAFLDLSVRVETIAPISKIGCPSHTVSTELGPDPTLPNFKQLPFSHYARVSLSSESALDKDFVLAIKSAGLDAPRCVAEVHPSHDTVAVGLTLVPRFTLPDIARQEYIILVDRSGSMEGARMTAARRALVVMLHSLPVKDCLFQIMSFGAGCSALWARGSKPYNQEMLDKATAHVDGMRANYGGTEMRNALQQCFAAQTSGRPTSVLVLTDGEAWDLEAVLDTVKNAVAAAPDDAPLRVSVLGIGDVVSTAMCEGIARVGNGACVIVGENETSFTGKIARLLKAAKTPLVSNISVDWGRPVDAVKIPESEEFEMVDKEHKASLNIFDESVDPTRTDEVQVPSAPPIVLPPPSAVQQSPFKIRNLFPGTRLNICAILQGTVPSRQIPDSVVLRGSTPDGATIELPIPITPSRLPEDPSIPPAIHALAARKIIQDLEDRQHELIPSIENPDDTDLLARTVKASVIRMGTTYSIASSHTSFVAVDEVG